MENGKNMGVKFFYNKCQFLGHPSRHELCFAEWNMHMTMNIEVSTLQNIYEIHIKCNEIKIDIYV